MPERPIRIYSGTIKAARFRFSVLYLNCETTMFKYTILSTCLLLQTANALNAQNYYSRPPITDSLAMVKKVAELSINESWIHKGKANTYRKIYHFDRKGLNVFSTTLIDTVKLKQISSSVITTVTTNSTYASANYNSWYKSGNLKLIEYNGDNLISATHYFNDKGKRNLSTRYYYKDSLMSRLEYVDRRNKLKSYYLYEYAPNKKLMHSALYRGNGKLVRYWDYACDDAGATVSKASKDTLKICTQKSYLADGTVISTTNSFDWRGEPMRQVEYRNAQNQVTRFLVYRGKNDVLTYKSISTYVGNVLSTYYIWNGDKSGKAYSASNHSYNADGMVLSHTDTSYARKKPVVRTYTYTYNEAGLPFSKSGYKNAQLYYTAIYRYRYYGKD